MLTTVHPEAAPRRPVHTWVQAHPFAAYVIAAYTFSWTLWTPAILDTGGPVTMGLYFAGVVGPAMAAAWVLHITGGSLRTWALQIVKWRVPARYYAYALGLPASLFAAVNLELVLLGQDIDLSLFPDRLGTYTATFLIVLTVGGGMEEPGWRGFALPLLLRDHTPVTATLLLGVVWAGWHLPLYGLGAVGPLAFVFFYTWLYNKTGSVLLCILLHASFTPALDHLVLRSDNLTVDLTILGTLTVAAAMLVVLTRGQLGYQSDSFVAPTPVGSADVAHAGHAVGSPEPDTLEVHLEELGQHSWTKALFNTLTGSYGSAQFRFVAHPPGGDHDSSDDDAVGATFPVMRFQDLNDRTEPNAWLDTAAQRLLELDQELTKAGWRRADRIGPHWWSLTYRKSPGWR